MESCYNYSKCRWRTKGKRHTCKSNSFVRNRRCINCLLLGKESPRTRGFIRPVCSQLWSSEIQAWETGLLLQVFTRLKSRCERDSILFWRPVKSLPPIHRGLLRFQDKAPSSSVPLSRPHPGNTTYSLSKATTRNFPHWVSFTLGISKIKKGQLLLRAHPIRLGFSYNLTFG